MDSPWCVSVTRISITVLVSTSLSEEVKLRLKAELQCTSYQSRVYCLGLTQQLFSGPLLIFAV
jgi:hypothetical protein